MVRSARLLYSDKKHLLRLVGAVIAIIIFAVSLNHIFESDEDTTGVVMGIVGIVASPIVGIIFYKWSNAS